VVANGVVKVDGNRKSVQHLDGGIVKERRVKEGDRIANHPRHRPHHLRRSPIRCQGEGR